ncbi:hypothetical protein [Streptomyces sp. NPDC088847]|uniref:hypothetical protein n=1 Tax=Streptomyces sp. NPDC088847 TaxID=3365909 RepID=UPI003801F3FD
MPSPRLPQVAADHGQFAGDGEQRMYACQIGPPVEEPFGFAPVLEGIARERRKRLVVGHQAGSSNGRTVTVVTAL